MTGNKPRSEITVSERGELVDADIYCEDGYCQVLLGPIDDLVMRRTAMITVEKENVEKLLLDIIIVTAKLLAKYLLTRHQEAKQ
jgi:hypothetical protein